MTGLESQVQDSLKTKNSQSKTDKMKKLLLLLIAAGSAASAIAQGPNQNYLADSLLPRWVIDLNLLGGLASQTFTTANTVANYPGALNMNTGHLKYKDGYAFGGDAQLGFFFGNKRHFGVGTGIMYMQQHGDVALDNFYAEYKATDGAGNIYRQVVTGHDIKENITSTNINVPIVLKYKNRFSKHWGFTADAGALINLQMKNAYTTHANFDYEAVYKFVPGSDGGTVSVYDNSSVPSVNDWLITKAEFLKNNPNGNLADYFAKKRALGYSVGESMTPASKTGHTSYTQGSIGFLIQPSFNYCLSDKTALNFGGYYMFQPFKNNAQSGYRITDGIGNYSSVLNSVTESKNQSYGINIGVRFFLGKQRTPLSIASVDQISPTQCGLCDGSFSIHGLFPNQPVTVDYSVNGAQPTKYSAIVEPDGKVKITNLCAGTYTGIVATIKKENAISQPITLTDPLLSISSQKATNPTASGVCDGSAKYAGLYSGKSATINYNLNGSSQTPFTGIINSDNSITMNGLCEGSYTGIVITCNTCTTNGADFTLIAPVPAPPPPITIINSDTYLGNLPEIATPILFDFDKSIINSSFYPILDEAAKEMNADKTINITIDGYTDIIGTAAYNNALSVRRANAVKKHLTNMGISPLRLRTVGHGFKSPVGDNATPEGRHKNRRSVMKITPAK